jgi:hypothetical protein
LPRPTIKDVDDKPKLSAIAQMALAFGSKAAGKSQPGQTTQLKDKAPNKSSKPVPDAEIQKVAPQAPIRLLAKSENTEKGAATSNLIRNLQGSFGKKLNLSLAQPRGNMAEPEARLANTTDGDRANEVADTEIAKLTTDEEGRGSEGAFKGLDTKDVVKNIAISFGKLAVKKPVVPT